MVDVSNRDIQATALLVIKRHRGSAGYIAASRADELAAQGAHTGARTWRRILAEIERLQAVEPGTTTH